MISIASSTRALRPLRSLVAAVAVLVLAACDNSSSTAATGSAPAAKSVAPAAKSVAPAAAKDWTTVVAATPDGGFRMGNPDAPVKLIEFASLTCPHCKEFHEEAMATMKAQYIAPGKLSYEYRSFVLNGPDLAASLLARCQGAPTFFNLLNAFYANQESWVAPFTKLSPEDAKRIGALPQDQQIAAIATAGGLDAFMRTRGMPKAKFDQCLSDQAAVDTLTKIRNEAVDKFKVTGTPGFALNGAPLEGVHRWSDLQPKLQAAIK